MTRKSSPRRRRSVRAGLGLGDEALEQALQLIRLARPECLFDRLVVGQPEVDAAIDAVGFEAKSHGHNATEAPAAVLNSLMSITRAAGSIGIPGLYVTEDPGAQDKAAQTGNLSMRFGLGWAKSHRFFTGQTPVLKYNRQLMQAILHDRLPIAKIVNATVITLDDAPQGYKDFDKGAAKKFVIDPHNLLNAAA